MCEKLKYCAREIDPCILDEIKDLNEKGMETVSSCCGHGRFPKTIIIKDGEKGYLEFYSGEEIFPEKKRYLNFYKSVWIKKERKRYYYLTEINRNVDSFS